MCSRNFETHDFIVIFLSLINFRLICDASASKFLLCVNLHMQICFFSQILDATDSHSINWALKLRNLFIARNQSRDLISFAVREFRYRITYALHMSHYNMRSFMIQPLQLIYYYCSIQPIFATFLTEINIDLLKLNLIIDKVR